MYREKLAQLHQAEEPVETTEESPEVVEIAEPTEVAEPAVEQIAEPGVEDAPAAVNEVPAEQIVENSQPSELSQAEMMAAAGVSEPYYDYAAQEWKNTEGWYSDGTRWILRPYYDHAAQEWKNTEGWYSDGITWHRQTQEG